MRPGIPFDKITPNGKIILYGIGENGKRCFSQITESGYAQIVNIVDNGHNGEFYKDYKILGVNDLIGIEYDQILISIVNVNVRNSILKDLISIGVSENKILGMQFVPVEDKSWNYLLDRKNLKCYIDETWNKRKSYAKCSMEIFYELFTCILCNESKDKEILLLVKEILPFIENATTRIFLLQTLYESKLFDPECMKKYMEALSEAEFNNGTKYALVIDTTFMVFENPELVYKEFFVDRKNLQYQICREFDIQLGKKLQTIEKEKKIAIVAERYYPSNVTDAPSQFVQAYALGLHSMGYIVKVFVLCSYATTNNKDTDVLPLFSASHEKVFESNSVINLPDEIEIEDTYCDNVMLRLQRVVNSIDAFEPWFVLDIADEMFAEACVLKERYNIFHLPMRGRQYSSVATKYLVDNKEDVVKDNEFYGSIDKNDVYEVKLGNTVFHTERVYARSDFGLNEEDFIIVTVGTRLAIEINEILVDLMVEYIENSKSIKWILVGDKPSYTPQRYQKLIEKERIIEWGIEQDIVALYKICDVYLNPIRKGGGLSIRIAMICGLPVVVGDLIQSDAFFNMNPQHILHGGYENYIPYMERLRQDSNFYKKTADQSLKQVETFSIESDLKKILSIGLLND